MVNNTAEASINVVHPYRLEVTIRDVTGIDQLKRLHAGDDFQSVQAFSMGLDLFDVAATGTIEPEMDLQDTHILIEEHYYKIKMNLYDKHGHKITLTDNLRFKSLELDGPWIRVDSINNIGSEVVIQTKRIENDQVKKNSIHKLDEIIPTFSATERYTSFSARLTQEKDLVITKPVKIQHPTNLVLLPFLPHVNEAHGSGEVWNLHARGGSGVYMWSIIDTSVATVQGSARVQSVNLGKTQLICRDHKNYNNWDAIDVEVAQLNKLAWIEEKVEINARPALNGRTSDLNRGYGEVRVLSLFA